MGVLIGTVGGVYDISGSPLGAGARINHLARDGQEWWAVDDAGAVWRNGELIVTSSRPTLNCIQPSPDDTWVGTGGARLFVLAQGALEEDEFFAEAPGRQTWHTPWGGPPDVRSMDFAPDGVLYINVHVGGILRYDNTGLASTVDIASDVHQVVAHPQRGGVVAGATAWGLALSTNGHDFEFHTDGLDNRYCRAVALYGDTVLISSSRGPGGSGARLYRGTPGQVLEPCRHGLPDTFSGNLDTHCLLAGEDGFFAANGNTVWSSDDEGATWVVIAEGLPQITCLA